MKLDTINRRTNRGTLNKDDECEGKETDLWSRM